MYQTLVFQSQSIDAEAAISGNDDDEVNHNVANCGLIKNKLLNWWF